MSPMLFGDLLDEYPGLEEMLRRKARWGFVVGLSAGFLIDELVRWLA